MLKTSVVIPFYNSSTTISDCIASCLHQDIKPLEIIIIDDCSIEREFETLRNVVQSFPDTVPIRIIRSEINRGPSACRNLGILNAKGGLIAFLDSDDTMSTNRIMEVERIFRQCDMIDIVGSGNRETPLSEALPSRASYIPFLFKNRYVTSSVTIKASCHFLFDLRLRYCEDYDLWLRLLESRAYLYIHSTPLANSVNDICFLGMGLSSNILAMWLYECLVAIRSMARRKYWFLIAPFAALAVVRIVGRLARRYTIPVRFVKAILPQ